MSDKKITYNRLQAEKYGWTPEWFDCTDFNQDLLDAIADYQRKNGLTADGLCGPGTYRIRWTEIESEGDFVESPTVEPGDKFIVHNGEQVEIFWDKVLLWTDDGGKKLSGYRSCAGKPDRKPITFVTHWDVTLSSAYCHKILEKRGLSVHFGIDNDGTVHQWLDTQHVAYHAGNRAINGNSIGLEITNAYELKWQSWYEKRGFGSRPIWKGAEVHGRTLEPFLGFYDVQLRALAALWEACSFACDIPLELPGNLTGIDPVVADGEFRGFVNHFNITTRKIDCAGLDNEKVMEMAKELRKRR
jgi:hypothetical protein